METNLPARVALDIRKIADAVGRQILCLKSLAWTLERSADADYLESAEAMEVRRAMGVFTDQLGSILSGVAHIESLATFPTPDASIRTEKGG